MSERQRGTCPECGNTDVPLAPKTGLLYKHLGPDGKACPGGGKKPATPQVDAVDEQDEDDWLNDDDEPTELPAPPPPAGGGEFTWELPVRQPALYLNDPAWHIENGRVAARAAQLAGHTPVGEARCTAVVASDDGAGLVLIYTLPIEGARRG